MSTEASECWIGSRVLVGFGLGLYAVVPSRIGLADLCQDVLSAECDDVDPVFSGFLLGR
jgi:hypothetical protein